MDETRLFKLSSQVAGSVMGMGSETIYLKNVLLSMEPNPFETNLYHLFPGFCGGSSDV